MGLPAISPLGTYGLGTGAFGAYDMFMPSTYGMGGLNYGGYGMMNPMMGMMGYYPEYMQQMQGAMNNIEASQLIHAGNMHGLMLNNEVQAYEDTDSALFRKILTNGDVQQGIYNLHTMVKKGDQRGVQEEYDKLKSYIVNTYKDEIRAKGTKKNVTATVNDYIEKIYGQIISAQYGQTRTLKSDLSYYGDNSFMTGLKQGLHPGHHSEYIDETNNYIFGTRIDEKADKDHKQTVGKVVGYGARGAKMGAIGAAAGVGATLAGATGLKTLFGLFGHSDKIKIFSKGTGIACKWLAAIGLVGAIIGDSIWRNQAA